MNNSPPNLKIHTMIEWSCSTAETNEKADALKAVSSKVINYRLLSKNKKIAEAL